MNNRYLKYFHPYGPIGPLGMLACTVPLAYLLARVLDYYEVGAGAVEVCVNCGGPDIGHLLLFLAL